MAEHDLHVIGTTTFEEVSTIPRNILLRNQVVALGDIRFSNKLKSYLYLECTGAGTTGAAPLTLVDRAEGNVITDGSATWTVRDFRKASSAGTATTAASCTGNAATATTAGTCTGNSATATKLQTPRAINGTNFDGSAAITTSKWGTARIISVQDATGTNTGAAVSVDGSGNVALKLPATIKGNVTGNCSGSSGSCTGNSATSTKVNGKTVAVVSSFSNGTLALTGLS